MPVSGCKKSSGKELFSGYHFLFVLSRIDRFFHRVDDFSRAQIECLGENKERFNSDSRLARLKTAKPGTVHAGTLGKSVAAQSLLLINYPFFVFQ